MKKKTYIKPDMQVIVMKQQPALLAGSAGARSLYGDEFSWDDDGFEDTNYDR